MVPMYLANMYNIWKWSPKNVCEFNLHFKRKIYAWMRSWFNWLVGRKRYLQFTNQHYIQSYIIPRNGIQIIQYKGQKLFDSSILSHLHQNYVNIKISFHSMQDDLVFIWSKLFDVCKKSFMPFLKFKCL